VRLRFLTLLLYLLPAPCLAQTPFYLHPKVGSLTLDFDLVEELGIEVKEDILWGIGAGYALTDRVALEGGYESAGFELQSEDFEPIHGRFHIVGAGVRVSLLATRPLDLWASVAPSVLITTSELTDASHNFALPVGLDLVVLPDRRIRARVGARDFLHLCEPPEDLDEIICDKGEWLHHVAATAGVEIQL